MTALATHETRAARPPGWWGMLLFVVTEIALFALLLASYFYVRFATADAWPQGGIEPPPLARPIAMTAILVAAGALVWWGRALLAALVLGAAFIGLQAWEYVDSLDAFAPQANAYASLFYTITAVHGAHVVVGVLLLGWLLAVRRDALATRIAAVYWVFLPAAWIAIFLSLYLSVRL